MSDITFLITAYNPSDFVTITIKSILNQTYTDFSILYIDDASSDNSLNSVKKITDPRLNIIKNKVRIGLIKSLNYGIKLVSTTYFVRFDADDIVLPGFLKNKIYNLDDDIILLGENILISDANFNIFKKTNKPLTDYKIKNSLLKLQNSINNPGVLLKKSAVLKAGLYRDIKGAEDYDLFVRMIKLGKFKNSNSYQLIYRVTGNSLTNRTINYLAESNILSLTNFDTKFAQSLCSIIYIYLFRKYSHKRGFSFSKIFFYPFFMLYRLLFSYYIRKKYRLN